ncbi:hypothetical protein J45TS6_42540 [Paenibacillus sp. J45TS6]|uniref:hypothetical protein n=1 Tax=Paenibacillus sp. J45TS6 TaxID=2807196 RepID=UPI001B2C2C93|nr:hypothetical protein [Paenibacillus sp. J45TS6]GIP45795.1 hypothetical protein J45TS6_42540 [Paenibacillus sp. J45TS6]
MDFWIYSVITIAYIILLLFMFTHLSRTKQWFHYPILLVILAFGLAYDNGIIAAGNAIGEGKPLMILSSLRFWIHAFVTPGLVLVGYYILQRSGAAFASKTYIRISAWILTLALILYQVFTQTLHEVKNLKLVQEYGVLRYTAEGTSGPPIMVIVVGLILLIIGIILIFRQKWIWMFVGTALLFIGQLIPLPFESSAATNIFELILIISLWVTIMFQDHKNGSYQTTR